MLAKRLKEFRKKNNLSQDDLGRLLNTNGKNVSLWERGITRPNIDTLKKMATLFNTTTDYLLGITDFGKDKFEQLKKSLEENGLKVNDDLTIVKILEEKEK